MKKFTIRDLATDIEYTNTIEKLVEFVNNDNTWYFLDNGYMENLPKAFTPRGSFSFYKKE